MGILEKFKKPEKKVLKQNLDEVGDRPGMIFVIHLLMEEKCEMPDKEFMQEVMEKHLGQVQLQDSRI